MFKDELLCLLLNYPETYINLELGFTTENHPDALPIIKKKLSSLKERLSGEPGKAWFDSMMEHINFDIREMDIFQPPEKVGEDPNTDKGGEYEDFFLNNNRLYKIVKGNIDLILEEIDEVIAKL